MVAFAIGVGDAERLPFLAGAHNGARGFHAWAVASGYESRLVIDDEEPVTFPRLKSELEAVLAPDSGPIHRMLLYFAGHGLIREAEEGLWLLSDWHKELRAVAVEVLRRRLYMHGIRQIGIFADACRSLPPDVDALDLTADAVLGRGPRKPEGTPALDKFIAAQDGTATFAVPGASPDDDRCLFSGVLLEALWGTRPSAFSQILPGKITSSSLGKYLTTEVPALSNRYGKKVVPTAVPAFPEGDNYYFGVGPKLSPPEFPPWPPAQELGDVPRQVLRLDSVESARSLSMEANPSMEERLHRLRAPTHFETRAGFAVEGARVAALWTPPDTFAEVQNGVAHWWRVGERNGFVLDKPVPVLVELANGTYVATTALPRFIGSILCDDFGSSALVYGTVWGGYFASKAAIEALGRMERGGLRASDILDEAVDLRHKKHVDPVLGAVSAYLYDSIGDLDNIRRMASAYHENDQPIPYDVALLAQLEAHVGSDGLIRVDIPAVPAREPRTEKESRFSWTHRAMPPSRAVVAGFWPLLRQGWAFLDDPVLATPELLELTSHLTRARFSTLDREGAGRLSTLFGLQRQTR
ncbi:hypothetical protein BE20_16760 [Sorangium cellulosum]|uniref:Uncharacterized protein n=1 Tax=Sorangium cellulosum TaxID=56 RepID=A0A150SEC3_SORCE|nr:hypothetical protein BE20_16760 [Sorangium cellulosum]KYF95806.1 hypothetical protein BE18_46680 [Sorangium cellulosum]